MNPETPDFKRLFVAVFLMTALLMGYNVLFGPKTKPIASTPIPELGIGPVVVPEMPVLEVHNTHCDQAIGADFTSLRASSRGI